MFLLCVLAMVSGAPVASTTTRPKYYYQGLLVVSGSTAAGKPTLCNSMENNSNFTWKNLEILLPADCSVGDRGGSVSDVGSEQGYNQPFNETMEFVNFTFSSFDDRPIIQWIVNDGVVWSYHVFSEGYEEYSHIFTSCDYNETAPEEGIYTYGELIFALNYTAVATDTSNGESSCALFSTPAALAISLQSLVSLILFAS